MNFWSFGISLAVMLWSILLDRTLFWIFFGIFCSYLVMNSIRQINGLNDIHRKIQSIAWNSSGNPTVFGRQEIDTTESEKFLERVNKKHPHEVLPLVIVFAKAIGTAFEKSKKLCGKVSFGQFILKHSANLTVFVHENGQYLGTVLLENCSELPMRELNKQYHSKVRQLKLQNEKRLLEKPSWVDYLPSVIVQTIMRISTWISYDLGLPISSLNMNPDHYGYAAISDFSSYGVTDFTGSPSPLMKSIFIANLNAPKKRAVYINGELSVRSIMYFNLAYDHRFGDGADAIKLFVDMDEVLENPDKYF
jgi:pyruvate/2-oxoglutarate dehydrogenase complex dihydrolipoamide acyltransferase (E2) component